MSKKITYACGPCRKLKIRCDHNVPCKNCQEKNRVSECLQLPAKAVTGKRKLSQPNYSFKRVRSLESASVVSVSTVNKLNMKNTPSEGLKKGELPQNIDTLASALSAEYEINSRYANVSSSEVNTMKTIIGSGHITDKNVSHFPQKIGDSLLRLLDLLGTTTKNRENLLKMVFISAIQLLPSRRVATCLKNYFLQYVDYIYHSLHYTTFNEQFEEFFDGLETKNYAHIDVLWLSLLFLILSAALIHLPKDFSLKKEELFGFQDMEKVKNMVETWSSLSIKLFYLGRDDKKPRLLELQIFSVFQIYAYATKQTEKLSLFLSMSVNTAYALKLNNADYSCSNSLRQELGRRLWWDVCGCDTFLALCKGRVPLIRSYHSTVPFPKNANDKDIGKDFIEVSDSNVPTDNSFNIHRAKMMKILNGIFEIDEFNVNNFEQYTHSGHLLEQLTKIDSELCSYLNGLPWYFKLNHRGNLPEMTNNRLRFQFHMLHICICVHRIRIYRAYLDYDIPIAWNVCLSAASSMLNVYKKLKESFPIDRNIPSTNGELLFANNSISPYYSAMIHQTFTGSVSQTMLLLKLIKKNQCNRYFEGKGIQSLLFKDVEMFLKDLGCLKVSGINFPTPVLEQSFKGLNMLHNLCFNLALQKSDPNKKNDQEDVIENVSDVFGGRQNTEGYLKKFSVEYIINDEKDKNINESKKIINLAIKQKSPIYFDYANQFGTMIYEDSKLVAQSIAAISKGERKNPGRKVKSNSFERSLGQTSSNALDTTNYAINDQSSNSEITSSDGPSLNSINDNIQNINALPVDYALPTNDFTLSDDDPMEYMEEFSNLDFFREWLNFN